MLVMETRKYLAGIACLVTGKRFIGGNVSCDSTAVPPTCPQKRVENAEAGAGRRRSAVASGRASRLGEHGELRCSKCSLAQ